MARPRSDLAKALPSDPIRLERSAAPSPDRAGAVWREAHAVETGDTLPPTALRVLSANLLGGRADPDALTALFHEAQVDLLCVQELGEPLADRLHAALPHGLLLPCPRRRGLGILSRRPFPVRRLELGGRDGLAATISPSEWPGLPGPVEVVNLHILAPHTWPYWPRRHRRPEQMRRLLAYLDTHPVAARAVVGDFNATPWWPVYRQMVARYPDVVAALPGRAPRTWPNLSRLGLPGLLRIDHCFAVGMRAQRAARLPIRGSDHYGLCVDLVPEDPPPTERGSETSDRRRERVAGAAAPGS